MFKSYPIHHKNKIHSSNSSKKFIFHNLSIYEKKYANIRNKFYSIKNDINYITFIENANQHLPKYNLYRDQIIEIENNRKINNDFNNYDIDKIERID
jgi:hypothetical protein